MQEPTLFERNEIEIVNARLYRLDGGWWLHLTYRRELDRRGEWAHEEYRELSWGELLDVLTATALS